MNFKSLYWLFIQINSVFVEMIFKPKALVVFDGRILIQHPSSSLSFAKYECVCPVMLHELMKNIDSAFYNKFEVILRSNNGYLSLALMRGDDAKLAL